MHADEYRALRERCLAEHAIWKGVAEEVRRRLDTSLREDGISADVTARPKEVDSLLRKLVLRYRTDDLTAVRDKAGARIVLHLPSDLEAARSIVRDLFPNSKEEDTAARLGEHEFGYRGIHFDAEVPEPGFDKNSVVGTLLCEIQLRTVAEHAWSLLSHHLLYKSPGHDGIPPAMRRRVHRLVAIVELFDQEARAAFAEITERPEYSVNAFMLGLERLHSQTVGDLLPSLRQCDYELTEWLLPLYGDTSAPVEALQLLAAFTTSNRDRLRAVIGQYDEAISPFVGQPEALVLWERLDFDATAVVEQWAASAYPMTFLEDMATIWGHTVSS